MALLISLQRKIDMDYDRQLNDEERHFLITHLEGSNAGELRATYEVACAEYRRHPCQWHFDAILGVAACASVAMCDGLSAVK